MGWNRIELKSIGRGNFQKNYGTCVLVSLVYAILAGLRATLSKERGREFIFDFFGLWSIGIAVTALLLGVFVIAVLEVGSCRFYVENRDYNAPMEKLFFGFQCGHYGNVVWVIFLRNVFLFLWTLLLIIPGIVKAYEYRMVPYILAEQPDINYSDAFSISKQMMDGQKMDTFILDLSFIGWTLLETITCGLPGIFWSQPYIDAVNGELYVWLRDDWMRRQGRTM